MFYEWRTYEAMPGKLPALLAHLEAAKGFFDAHGLPTLGFWTDEIGTAGQVSYVWSYENLAQRAERLTGFASDQGWRAVTAEETAREGTIVANITNVLWQPTRYSPEPKLAGGIQELRTYDALPGKLPAVQRRFADHTLALFQRHGLTSIGYWTETFGNANRLVYMLGFPGVAERESAWAAFQKDPEWIAARSESEKDGPLLAKITNRLLRPTRFSPR